MESDTKWGTYQGITGEYQIMRSVESRAKELTECKDSGGRLKRPYQSSDNRVNSKRRSTGSKKRIELTTEDIIQDDKRKMDIWRRMQRIAFEMSGDADRYLPGSDPRDFNVLWRSYITEINAFAKQEPLIEEPGDDDEPVDDNNNNNIKRDRSIEVESIPDESIDLDDELTIDDRINNLHIFLRHELYYCYYCGIQFKNERDLHSVCPGLAENEH